MKAHISHKMIEAGGKPLCGVSIRRTSGYSSTLEEWKTELSGWQCENCAASLAKIEAKMATRKVA